MTGQSNFMLIFFIPWGQFTKSHQLRKVTLVDFDCRLLTRWPLFCKSLVRVVFLHTKFGGFIVFYYVFKNCLFVENNGSLHFNYSCCRKVVLWMDDPVYSYCHRYTKKINCRTRHWWKKEKIRQMNFHCTVYTGTTWNDFVESHQLRTMNARGHINSVPWMTAVTSTPYHEWTRSH